MKLSPKQFSVYCKLDYNKSKSAYELRCSLSTLNALVKKGYAIRHEGFGSGFFPRNAITFKRTDKAI